MLEPGYTVLSKKEETTPGKEVDSQPLPPLQKGDIASIAEGAVETKQTKPPNPYTEATLLTAMEYAGKFVEDEELREKMGKLSLGTPATRASIIERLLQVGYIAVSYTHLDVYKRQLLYRACHFQVFDADAIGSNRLPRCGTDAAEGF